MGTIIRTPNGDFDTHIGVTEVSVICRGSGNEEIVALYLQSWLCLLADSPLVSGVHEQKPRKVFSRFKREVLSCGNVRDIILRYSAYADHILKTSKMTGESTNTGVWLPDMINTPIFREYHAWFHQGGDPKLLHFIISFLWFGKKMDYEDPELNSTAFHRWEEVEERLSGVELPSMLIDGLRMIIRSMLPKRKLSFIAPHFGPGAVAERGVRGHIQKSDSTSLSDPRIRHVFGRPNIFLDSVQTGLRYEDCILNKRKKAKKRSSRNSRLKDVRKNAKTARIICMQPNKTMYWEQCYTRHLQNLLADGWGRWFVDLSDQTINRELSQYGSATTLIDTIDLSDASDTVRYDLVESIFPREVVYFLKALRIDTVVLPDGSVRRVSKYAPMGSALCFPVQCITFLSAVVYSAIQFFSGTPLDGFVDLQDESLRDPESFVTKFFMKVPGYSGGGSRRANPSAVYGDDILCDSKFTQFVIHNLHRLGFKVNESKSFMGGDAVRESCGGYYFCGSDVTPLLFRVKRWSGLNDPTGVTSIIAAINAAGDHRFMNLKRCLTQFLMYSGSIVLDKPAKILFTDDRDQGFGIYHPKPRNTHLKRRVTHESDIPEVRRESVRCMVVTPGRKRYPRKGQFDSYEAYLYNQWWISRGPVNPESDTHPDRVNIVYSERPDRTITSPGERDEQHHEPGPTRLGWRWIPA